MKVSPETKITDALNASPAVVAIFEKYNIQCGCCGGAAAESLAICARMNGLDPDELAAEINRAIESSQNRNGT